MKKKISIIIPCYNVEQYIGRCFDSLKKQTIGIDNLELIFIDDCSTDGTWNRLLQIERECPESVMIIHCDENGRQGRARNIGLQYVSAPYIGFVDADDWIELDMYECMYEKMIANACDIVMCGSWRDMDCVDQMLSPRREDGAEDQLLVIDTVEKRKQFLANSMMEFCVWNKLYKSELILQNDLMFPERLAYEDHYFATLLYFYARRVYLFKERCYHYFVNTESTVMKDNAKHHFDILSVDTLLWDECERRGLLRDYREELEYQFLSLCYLTTCKMLLLRFNKVPYDFFVKLKSEVVKRVPSCRDNKYVGAYVTDLYKIILELLGKNVTETELDTIFQTLREYVHKGLLKV